MSIVYALTSKLGTTKAKTHQYIRYLSLNTVSYYILLDQTNNFVFLFPDQTKIAQS